MHITVQREPSRNMTTLGKLYVNGEFFCGTLEDEVREVSGRPVAEWKQWGRTAIPCGLYEVTLEDSPRFGPSTMTVNGVHGFDKIRIHAGNTHEDTHGCLLVGVRIGSEAAVVSQSRRTLAELKKRVAADIEAGKTVLIEYKNPVAEA